MMMEFSKKSLLSPLVVLALGVAGCPIQAGDQIPCVEDVTCPAQYPVCGPSGKCIAGTSGARASIAIVGADGYAPTDLLSGTVRMLVVARAATGVATVTLASGTTNFAASSAAAAPPLFAFDVDTTAFPNGDVPVAATVVAGDASTGTANGVLHVDNALPPVSARITAFSVGTTQAASTGSANISTGGTTKLWASFTGRGNLGATLSCAPACNSTLSATSIANGGNVTVTGSVNGALTYTLTVTPSTGPSVTSNLTINVVPLANAISLTTTPSVIHQGGSATLTPAFDFGSSPAVPGTARIVGTDGSMYSNLVTGIGVQVAPTAPTTTYSLQVSNAAGAAAASVPTATVTAASGTWSQLNNNTFDVLVGATVTALDNGKVLIAGGLDGIGGAPVKTAILCDATGACVRKTATLGTAMVYARAFHTAVKIGNSAPNNAGKVLLAGGYTAAGPATPTALAEFYDPATDTFSSTTAITGARARHVAVLLGDGRNVLIAGGTDGASDLSSAIKYDAGAATPVASVSNAMAQQRASFTGTWLPASGKVLIVGGKTGNLTAELFDPAGAGAFSSTGALPAGEDKRSHTAVLIGGASINSGKVLISGGVNGVGGGTPSSTQFLYTPGSGTFDPTSFPMATARSNHAAISLSTDSVLICGGTDGTNTLKTCERYDPASGNQFPTAPLMEVRRDFGLAPITISSLVEILAAGGPATVMIFAETYNPN